MCPKSKESVQFNHSVVSNSFRPHGLQHARPPYPSPTHGVYSNSCSLRQWCHPTIWSSVVCFSSHLQSFPALGSFQMCQFFASVAKVLEFQFQHQSFQFDLWLAIWSLVPLLFSKSSLIIWKLMVHVLLKPGLENFEHFFTNAWDECNCAVVWAFRALRFLGIGMKNDLFQSCGLCWVLQICCHIECSTFAASSFRIWNSSTGIPSPLLALFIVMLPKAHLTSHSRMFGSRWVITPSWLSGSWRSFLYSSSMYCCQLFLLSSASTRSIPFLSFIVPIFAWKIPLVSLIFLQGSLVFLILLFSSISLHWSLRKAFLSLLAVLWDSAFKWVYLSFSPLPFISLFTAYVRPLQTTILPFCISFSWGWFWSLLLYITNLCP